MKKRFLSALMSLIILIGTSCANRRITYFQASSIDKDTEQTNIAVKYQTKIQNGDILSITVSSLSVEASTMFNPYQSTSATSATSTVTPGYLIDEEGYITIPLIGKLKLEGLTTKEATDLITSKLDKYLQQPTVNLRILNFKVSVLGEVNRPSVYTVQNEKITLPEAIGLAGDLTIYGIRTNVLVIRENNGKREFGRIDLSKRDFFNSPYYYLHANDVVYVEATKTKFAATDPSTRLLPIIISSISLLTVMYSAFLR